MNLVIPGGESVRADRALLDELRKRIPTLSRAALKDWFQNKRIRLGAQAISASHELPPGSHTLTLQGWLDFEPKIQGPPQAQASPGGCFLPIVYEDDELLVLNKHSGVPSVPQSSEETRSAVGAALAYLPALQTIGRSGLEPAILHRLDTGTSGLLVFAKSQSEFERLRALWSERQVRKIYRALVRDPGKSKTPDDLQPGLFIDFPLAHDAKSAKRMIAIKPGAWMPQGATRGNPIFARSRILNLTSISEATLDVEIEIETGVMHQIRCHLASLGWPIQGDPVYRGVPSSRLWLHAWKLEIPLTSGVLLKLESQLPDRWPGK